MGGEERRKGKEGPQKEAAKRRGRAAKGNRERRERKGCKEKSEGKLIGARKQKTKERKGRRIAPGGRVLQGSNVLEVLSRVSGSRAPVLIASQKS